MGTLFRAFRDFLTIDFSFIFEVTSESELSALWRRKGAQKEVFGEAFRSDFEVSGESENKAPVWTPAPFSRFQGAKKSKQILRYFRKGSEGARGWRFLMLLAISGACRGSKRSSF